MNRRASVLAVIKENLTTQFGALARVDYVQLERRRPGVQLEAGVTMDRQRITFRGWGLTVWAAYRQLLHEGGVAALKFSYERAVSA